MNSTTSIECSKARIVRTILRRSLLQGCEMAAETTTAVAMSSWRQSAAGGRWWEQQNIPVIVSEARRAMSASVLVGQSVLIVNSAMVVAPKGCAGPMRMAAGARPEGRLSFALTERSRLVVGNFRRRNWTRRCERDQ